MQETVTVNMFQTPEVAVPAVSMHRLLCTPRHLPDSHFQSSLSRVSQAYRAKREGSVPRR